MLEIRISENGDGRARADIFKDGKILETFICEDAAQAQEIAEKFLPGLAARGRMWGE